jgi:epsilon-lactone hydrolase
MDILNSDKNWENDPRKRGAEAKTPRADECGHGNVPRVNWPDIQPSLRSRLIDHMLLVSGWKKRWASAEVVQERARKLALGPRSHRPIRLGNNVKFDLRTFEGWHVYDVESLKDLSARHHVIFLHGGAYVHEIVGSHWSFVGFLSETANTHCVVPIYPLAPRGTAKDVVPTTGRIILQLIENFGAHNVTVIGNSAGGGLSVAAAQWLRDAGHPQPNALILICPGINGALNQCNPADAARDLMQDIPGMIEAFRLYAGDLDLGHPFVSPLNGSFDGLAQMLIFSGTHDLYHPDIVALANKAASAGVPVEMHVRNGLQHNYPLLPTPEGREARGIIARKIAAFSTRASDVSRHLGSSMKGGTMSEANKANTVAFHTKAVFEGDVEGAFRMHGGAPYRQHNPLIGDGMEGLRAFVAWMRATRPGAHGEIKSVFADGDYVVLHSHWHGLSESSRGEAVVDIYRCENGKVVEHWDVIQPIPETAANGNTMF